EPPSDPRDGVDRRSEPGPENAAVAGRVSANRTEREYEDHGRPRQVRPSAEADAAPVRSDHRRELADGRRGRGLQRLNRLRHHQPRLQRLNERPAPLWGAITRRLPPFGASASVEKARARTPPVATWRRPSASTTWRSIWAPQIRWST